MGLNCTVADKCGDWGRCTSVCKYEHLRGGLARFKNLHRGETCVIIGNGPSLRLSDLELLSDKYITFGSNQIFRLPFAPTYYSIIDKQMMDACLPLPKDFRPKEIFLRAEACVEGNNPIYPIVAAGFGVDIANFVVMGGTVTFALMQIAFYMGFETMLLIGVDHSYPKSSLITSSRRFVADGEDPDHFKCADGKPYFKEGVTYNAPELKGTTQSYAIARQLFDQAGRRAVNISRKTALDVFEKDQLENWI